MNLQENIERIQSMMGVINENDGPSKIDRMIGEIGLGSTIKFFGGYENFKEVYGKDISKEDKINFINQSVENKTQDDHRNFIYLSNYLGHVDYLYRDSDIVKTIDYLYVGFLRANLYINVNNNYQFAHTATIKYDELSNDELNLVLKTVLKIV